MKNNTKKTRGFISPFFLFANGLATHIMQSMKNKAVKIGIVASVLPHIFCCGLPIALSIVSLFAPELAHANAIIPEWLEPWIFVFSAGMLGLSWVLVLRECKCECDHCHGDRSHRVQKIILTVVTIIFIISILLHVVAHH